MSNALTSRLKKKKKGFTLIELIIVIAIIAILGAIAIPSFTKIRENSKEKADIASSDTIKKTIMTLITDGSLKKGAEFKIDPSLSGGARIVGYDPATEGTITATSLADFFNNTNSPQAKDQKTYSVTVDANTEVVTVVTATN